MKPLSKWSKGSVRLSPPPAKPDSCPFGDRALCLLLDFFDDRGNILLGISIICMVCEVRANGSLLFFCVRWEPSMTGILAL